MPFVSKAHALRRGLKARRPEIEIRVVGGEGAPPISTKDEALLEFLEREGFRDQIRHIPL